jgi:hypothetical protein
MKESIVEDEVVRIKDKTCDIKFKNFKFNPDRIFGEEAEDLLTELIIEKKLEVKADRKTIYTGNIAIEHISRGKPSGIKTTEADNYIYEVMGKDGKTMRIGLIIPIDLLKKLFDKYKNIREYNVRGGDNKTSEIVLVPFKEFFNLDNFNDSDLIPDSSDLEWPKI